MKKGQIWTSGSLFDEQKDDMDDMIHSDGWFITYEEVPKMKAL